MSPRWLARVLGAALTLVTAARGAPPTITVSDASGLDADAVRAAVARELAADDAGGAVDVRLGAGVIEVTARLKDGRSLTRTIARPAESARAAEAAALLAGNLVRDQTSDLEEELRRRRARDVATSPPGGEAQPPPASQPPSCGAGRSLPALELIPGVVAPPSAADPGVTRTATLALVGGHRGPTRGASIALLGTHGSRSICGAHLSGLWDWSFGWVRGAQLAGVAVSATSVDGAQIAPLSRASSTVRGTQLAVVALAGDVVGAQVAVVDVARDVYGAQLGVVNVARRARGVQLGLVNVADDSDAPIGVINVIRRGRLHTDAWLFDFPGAAAALVHGGRYTHTIYGAGARRSAAGDARAVGVLGLGAHVPVTAHGFLDVDALTHFLPDGRFTRFAHVFQLRVIAGVVISERLSLFAGPTANLSQSPPELDEQLSVFGSTRLDWGGGAAWRAWPGGVVGVRGW